VGSTIDKTWVLLVYSSLVGLRLSVVGSVASLPSVGFAHHEASSKLPSLLLLPKKPRVENIPKWAEGFAAQSKQNLNTANTAISVRSDLENYLRD
jgi:hypothetical protein